MVAPYVHINDKPIDYFGSLAVSPASIAQLKNQFEFEPYDFNPYKILTEDGEKKTSYGTIRAYWLDT